MYTHMHESGIYAIESPYLERYVQIGLASGRVLKVSFPTAPDDAAANTHEILDRVEQYFEGAKNTFDDIDVALTLPTDKRAVLLKLREVPFGTQISVKQLAAMTSGVDPDDEEAIDLVREALAANPAPIIIPDQRVRDGPSAAPPDVEQKLRTLEGL